MEDFAAERVIIGDYSSAKVDTYLMCLTSFGDDSTGPPDFPSSRDDTLVDNDAAVPKPCLSPLEIPTLTAAGGLLPIGKASTATRIIYYQSRLRFCPNEKTNSERTSIQYTIYHSSFWRVNNQAAPFWRRVIETKSRKLWCLILAALQVVYAPARFWQRGMRCFMGSFSLGR